MRKLAIRISQVAGYAIGVTVSFIRTWGCFVMFKPIEIEGRVYRRKRIVASIIIFPFWLFVALIASTFLAIIAASVDVFESSNHFIKPRKPIKQWTLKERALMMRHMTFGE